MALKALKPARVNWQSNGMSVRIHVILKSTSTSGEKLSISTILSPTGSSILDKAQRLNSIGVWILLETLASIKQIISKRGFR